jgi:hypothetical protein
VLKAVYCSALGVPVVEMLQARRERERGPQVPGVVAGEQERGATCLALCCVFCLVSPSVPCGRGVRPPFIDQGESESHACRAI